MSSPAAAVEPPPRPYAKMELTDAAFAALQQYGNRDSAALTDEFCRDRASITSKHIEPTSEGETP